MAISIEKQLREINQKLDAYAFIGRYMRIEMFCEKYGYTRREIDHLRSKHPQIWDGQGGDKVSSNNRTVWRDIRIDILEWNKLFSSPIKKLA